MWTGEKHVCSRRPLGNYTPKPSASFNASQIETLSMTERQGTECAKTGIPVIYSPAGYDVINFFS